MYMTMHMYVHLHFYTHTPTYLFSLMCHIPYALCSSVCTHTSIHTPTPTHLCTHTHTLYRQPHPYTHTTTPFDARVWGRGAGDGAQECRILAGFRLAVCTNVKRDLHSRKRDLVTRQKRPTTMRGIPALPSACWRACLVLSKETYSCAKRDLFMCQKRPTMIGIPAPQRVRWRAYLVL